jgi:hypothetical protein
MTAYPQKIKLPIKIIAINCQLILIAALEKKAINWAWSSNSFLKE